METEFWIEESKFHITLKLLAHIAQYSLSQWDYDAIYYGLEHTNVWEQRYFDYPLLGNQPLHIKWARDEDNTDLIFIFIQCESQLQTLIELAVFTVQTIWANR